VGGEFQWTIPMRAYSAACWLAMCAQRHMYEFGTTHEQLAQITLTRAVTPGSTPWRFSAIRSRSTTISRRA